jgi:hypothetical protein
VSRYFELVLPSPSNLVQNERKSLLALYVQLSRYQDLLLLCFLLHLLPLLLD